MRQYFLRELKEQGLLVVRHVSGELNDADIFTKNLPGPRFNNLAKTFVGDDEYNEKPLE